MAKTDNFGKLDEVRKILEQIGVNIVNAEVKLHHISGESLATGQIS